jgi:hypothetical protein
MGNDRLAWSDLPRKPPDGTRSPVATPITPGRFSPALAAGVLLAACTNISGIFIICL